jgi:YD repeat-containing protein
MDNGSSSASLVMNIEYTYDPLYRLKDATYNGGYYRFEFTYDAASNRTQLTYPDSKTVTYDYDPANRLVQVTDWDLSVTGYDYDDADRLVSIARPNLVTSTYSYDAAGQLLSLSHAGSGGTLSSFDYTYDGVGNRVAVTETFTSTVAIAYTYDPLYRLTAADYSDLSYFHYTYDAVGNRLSYEITGGETITYTYDTANRMTSAGGVNTPGMTTATCLMMRRIPMNIITPTG